LAGHLIADEQPVFHVWSDESRFRRDYAASRLMPRGGLKIGFSA
jgi:hypothetical protein